MHSFLSVLAQSNSSLNQQVTITFVPSQVLTWVIIGLIAGYVANWIVRGRRMNPIVTVIVGIIGAFVGNFLFSLLRIQVSSTLMDGITIRWIDLITAAIGAIIILFLFVVILRRR